MQSSEVGGGEGARRGRVTMERWGAVSPVFLLAMALMVLPLLLLVPRFLLFAQHSLAMIQFPWQIDYDEGVILHSSWLLAGGHNPYPAPTPDSFVSSVYTPLFYAMNAAAINMAGLNLWSGRLFSLLGTLLAAFTLWGWVRVESGSRVAGLVAAGLWLALGPVIVWSTFYKQDILALAWGMLGGLMVAAGTRESPYVRSFVRRSNWSPLVYLAIVPFLLAFWTKQSALATFAAAALYLLLRDRRDGLRWIIVAAVAFIVPYFALDLALKGNLSAHLFAPGGSELSVERLARNLGALTGENWPLLLLGLAGLVNLLVMALRNWQTPSLAAFFGLVSIPATLLFNMLRIGNYNHLLNALLPLCLLAGLLAGSFLASNGRQGRRQTLSMVVVAGLIGVQAFLFAPIAHWYTPLGQPLEEKAARMEQIDKLVAQTPGDMLSEDNWLLLKNGKRVFYDDPAAMATYGGNGRWDNSTLLADINRRKFSLLILEYDLDAQTYNPRWEQPVLDALKANYATQFRDVRFVHVPRPAPDTAPIRVGCPISGGPQLAGIALPVRGYPINPGDSAQLSLYWLANADPRTAGLKVSLRLLDGGGNALWQADIPPGAVAGTAWPNMPSDRTVRDDFTFQVPANTPPGAYRIVLSSYVESNGSFVPAPIACMPLEGDGSLLLADGQIVGR